MIFLALFSDTNCGFGEALLEWALIGFGFFLFGWMLKTLFTGRSYKREYEELRREHSKLERSKNEVIKSEKKAQIELAKAKTAMSELRAKKAEPSVPLRAHHELKDENLQLSRKIEVQDAKIEEMKPNTSSLQIIEGIGPSLEGVLQKAGINNLEMLANTSRDDLKLILDKAGDRFRIHEPRSWPHQAELARKGEMEKLKEYQEFLMGGKE